MQLLRLAPGVPGVGVGAGVSRHQGVKEPPLCPDCGYTHREDNCPNAPSLQGVKVCNCTGRIFTTCGCEVHGLQGVKEPDSPEQDENGHCDCTAPDTGAPICEGCDGEWGE